MDEAPIDFRLLEPASPESLLPGTPLWIWLTVGSIVAILIAAGLRLLLRRSRTRTHQAIRDAAMRDALAALDQLTTTTARDTAVEVSLILRRFLATTAGDPALYETHEEFVMRQDSLQSLSEATRILSQQSFEQLAKLKYAPETPETDLSALTRDTRQLLQTLYQEVPA